MTDTNNEDKNKIDDIVASITSIDATSLLEKAKNTYSERYSDKLAQLIEDNMRLERALRFVRESIKKVADGDILAIEDYMESRKKLEDE